VGCCSLLLLLAALHRLNGVRRSLHTNDDNDGVNNGGKSKQTRGAS